MAHYCFKKGCEHEVYYVCLCLCCKTFCCEFHLETHLKLPNRTHSFDSILTQPEEWKKSAILEFLEKEKLKKEKLKKIVLATGNYCKNIEENLREIIFDLEKINDLIEKISQVSEKDEENVLNLSILMPDSEKAKEVISELYRNVMLFCYSCKLRYKKWSLLNRVDNSFKTEQNFRRTCKLYKNFASDPLLSQAYQEYINAYQKLTSIYYVWNYDGDNPQLFIYNTEKETEEIKNFEFPQNKRYCKNITKFPNGDLIFISSGRAFIIDSSDQVREIPVPEKIHQSIFFNRNLYCFVKTSKKFFLRKFDLDKNLWNKLTTIRENNLKICSSVIFNGNIIISRYKCEFLLLYSIDIDSFSKISHYDFHDSDDNETNWHLISSGLRLYMVRCSFWGIFESEIENPYSWNSIGLNSNYSDYEHYFSYNKGAIFFLAFYFEKNRRNYFKFDLFSKNYIDIACYRKHLAIKQSENKFEAIEWNAKAVKFDSELSEMWIDKGLSLPALAYALEKIECKSGDKLKPGYNYGKSFYSKGLAFHSIGNNLEALECFNQAIKICPKLKENEGFYWNITETLIHMGRYQEAIKWCSAWIKFKPKECTPYFLKGINYHNLGMFYEAIVSYDKAVKFDGGIDSSEIKFRKGYALYNLGKRIEAMKWYNKVTKCYEESFLFVFNRAYLLNDLGQEAKVLKDFNKTFHILEWKYGRYDRVLDKDRLNMCKAFANLQGDVVEFKEKMEKMKDKNLQQKMLIEYKVKWKKFKKGHSELLKRGAEFFDDYKVQSIKAIRQVIKEVDELYWELSHIIGQ